MFDPWKIPVARNAIKEKLAVVPSDGIIARLRTQMIRDQRLAPVFLKLLSHRRGIAPYIRGFSELAGNHPVDLDGRFEKAVVIGAVRKQGGRTVTHLNPPRDFRLQRDDMLVLLARAYDDCEITRYLKKLGRNRDRDQGRNLIRTMDIQLTDSTPDTDLRVKFAGKY
jgi:hypothetical protein